MKTFLVNGLPDSVARDGWWLSGTASPTEPNGTREGETGGWQPVLLAALIALGDVMIWQVVPGVSMAVFGAALVLAALWVARHHIAARKQAFIAAVAMLVLLPLVEIVNPLSMGIAVVGVSVLLVLSAGVRLDQLPRAVFRLWPFGARQTVRDAARVMPMDGEADLHGALGRFGMAWGMPALLGFVFLALLLAANPIADQWLADLSQMRIELSDSARLVFWICLLPLAWTVLTLRRFSADLAAGPAPARFGPRKLGLINPASVTRALLIFNLLFAGQTGMDLVYLYGGFGLPDGITYAQYAHRGAYPLVVTGLLAGGFALLTRPWVQGDRLLRIMLMVFVAQNVALVVSSLVRLEMYVDQYGLTQLRVAAGIWMGLTASGLALILWQIAARFENGWLMLRGAVLTAVVFYVCAWIPFDGVIARYNLMHHAEDQYATLSYPYVCHLGDAAKPEIVQFEQREGFQICNDGHCSMRSPKDWREWGWRNARARSSLALLQTEARP